MNIFTRFWTAIKAQVNAFIDKVEDPQRVLDQSIRDMQKHVDQMRGDVIKVLAEEKKVKNQLRQHEQDINRWEKNAMLALKEGDEELAREALRRKRSAVKMEQQLKPQWEQQQAISERLKNDFTQLRERIQTAQRKKRNLVLRLRQAETQKRLQGMLNQLSDNQVFDKFEDKLLQTEMMNEAQQELQEPTLEQKFEALESSSDLDVDQELEAMKERLKLSS